MNTKLQVPDKDGHGMPERKLVAGSWLYANVEEQSAAIDFLLLGFNLAAFDNFLEEPGWDASSIAKAHLSELLTWRTASLNAWKAADHRQTKAYLMLMKSDMDRVRERETLLPLARKGNAFKPGRRAGTISPLRKAVRAFLARFPEARPLEVWKGLKAKPPRGMSFYDAPRLGKYIQTEGQPDTEWRRFQNIVSEEKKARVGS